MPEPAQRFRRELEDQRALSELALYADVPQRVAALYAHRARAIHAAWAAGLSVARIAAALGCSRKVVYDAIPEYHDAAKGD